MGTENRLILALSNTYLKDKPWLEHAKDDIRLLLSNIPCLTIVPYALFGMDDYFDKLSAVFKNMVGITKFNSPHQHPGEEQKIIADAQALYIGGGNTWQLNANLHALTNCDGSMVDPRPDACRQPLIDQIRHKALEDPIIGASAGSNVMFRDIRTTNDMDNVPWEITPGVVVSRLDALGLFPPNLRFNPHYIEKVVVTEEERSRAIDINQGLGLLLDHQGESRETRLRQVLEIDPSRIILALREGAYLRMIGNRFTIQGTSGGLIFRHQQEPEPIYPEMDLSDLLH